MIKDSGQRREFASGAVRDIADDKGRMDLLPCRALIALSKHYQAGCQKYGDRNWEKGIQVHCYLDSGLRHAFKYLMGQRDEPHLEAACWNLMCALDTIERIKDGTLPADLFDIPGEL